LFNAFDDFCHAVARQLFCYSAVALILLVVAIAIAPLRAEESAAQRPTASEASANQLLDGFVRYTLHDHARAREFLEPLAYQGNADAQHLVGYMYANGAGVAQHSARAAHWFSLAAEQGKADAQFALGTMYRDGAGVPKDRALALMWLRRAAESQHSDAANALGELYLGSDHAEAAGWFERAALMGNGTAPYHLGMFALAQRAEQSDIQAYKWFELSARTSLGDQRDLALHELVALRERMMPLQIEVAKRLVRDWVSRSQWARWGRW
jgi:uncharacterized protein